MKRKKGEFSFPMKMLFFFNEKVYPKSPFSTENPKNAWKNVKFPGKTLLSRKKTVTTLPIHFWDYVYKNEK